MLKYARAIGERFEMPQRNRGEQAITVKSLVSIRHIHGCRPKGIAPGFGFATALISNQLEILRAAQACNDLT